MFDGPIGQGWHDFASLCCSFMHVQLRAFVRMKNWDEIAKLAGKKGKPLIGIWVSTCMSICFAYIVAKTTGQTGCLQYDEWERVFRMMFRPVPFISRPGHALYLSLMLHDHLHVLCVWSFRPLFAPTNLLVKCWFSYHDEVLINLPYKLTSHFSWSTRFS